MRRPQSDVLSQFDALVAQIDRGALADADVRFLTARLVEAIEEHLAFWAIVGALR